MRRFKNIDEWNHPCDKRTMKFQWTLSYLFRAGQSNGSIKQDAIATSQQNHLTTNMITKKKKINTNTHLIPYTKISMCAFARSSLRQHGRQRDFSHMSHNCRISPSTDSIKINPCMHIDELSVTTIPKQMKSNQNHFRYNNLAGFVITPAPKPSYVVTPH